MATPNIIVLGSNNNVNKQLKPIKLLGCVIGDFSGFNKNVNSSVHSYKNVELISKKNLDDDGYSHDLIFCYDDNRNVGTLFYGEWNDGVAE